MLILFDIDLTLITTAGAGIRAMARAGTGLFGPAFRADGVSYAGRLDPVIMREMLEQCGVRPDPSTLAAFRRAYAERLPQELTAGDCLQLPGVAAALDAVAARPAWTLGLLTGNFRETGSLKLRACGIDPERFAICAWGDEAPREPATRDQLPRVAMDRFKVHAGRDADPSTVVIIGDTEHDVQCARANGCRVIGVATGRTSIERLREAGADHVTPDLSDTRRLIELLQRWSGSR